MKPKLIFLFLTLIAVMNSPVFGESCAPLSQYQINNLFKKLALKQLQLEFGPDVQVSQFLAKSVSDDLIRMEFMGRYLKPGRADYSKDPLSGWITRCGTVIFRGHTWLASGELEVPRFTREQLPGKGVVFGSPKAKVHVIAFVDSRCSQCHRLIAYAKELIKKQTIYIEFRQVAYLETVEEAVQDTQVSLSPLVLGSKSNISKEEYLDMVSGFASDQTIEKNKAYTQALDLVKRNTQTAKQLLNIRLVPGVLISDRVSPRKFRLTAYWEMNRIFQPDL